MVVFKNFIFMLKVVRIINVILFEIGGGVYFYFLIVFD